MWLIMCYQGTLERHPTPYPKEMKHRIQHMRNLALKQLNIPNGDVRREGASQQSPGGAPAGQEQTEVGQIMLTHRQANTEFYRERKPYT